MMRWHSAGMLLLSSAAAAAGPRVHTVFCAECTNNFDYKSIGAFWSHNISGMPGGITRLLACDENQMKTYRGMSIGPTFVHINHGHMRQQRELLPGETKHPHGSRQTDSSPSYNKPGSIMHWIQESEEAKHVDYVLYIDADMLIRRPMDPIALGVKPGVVVSEHVGYLDVGIKNGLPAMFLPPEFVEYAGADVHVHTTPPPEGLRVSAGGWYHFFHVDDIRAIAHRWLHYCKEMRLNPQKYWKIIDPDTGLPSGTDHDILTGDAYVGRNQAPWISEMCAAAHLRTHLRRPFASSRFPASAPQASPSASPPRLAWQVRLRVRGGGAQAEAHPDRGRRRLPGRDRRGAARGGFDHSLRSALRSRRLPLHQVHVWQL